MSKLKCLDELFDGRHFDREIIILCGRRYPRDKLSLGDLVEMIPKRDFLTAWLHNQTPVEIQTRLHLQAR